MKRLLLAFIIITSVLISCKTTPKYTINGTIKNLDAKKVFLKEYQGRKTIVVDSAIVKDGKFVMEGTVDKTKACGLFIADSETNQAFLFLFVENVDYTIDFDQNDIESTTIKGGPAQELYNQFIDIFKKYSVIYKPIEDKHNKANSDFNKRLQDKKLTKEAKEKIIEEYKNEISKIRNEFRDIDNKVNKEMLDLIKQNPSSYVSTTMFYSLYSQLDVNEAKEIVNSFEGEASEGYQIKKIKEYLTKLEKVAVGKQAPDFTLNTPDGTPLSLSSFKGKVLILDFWASWCGPCREESPKMVKIYKKYKNKGLEILGVSLDKKKEEWLKAIKEDGLTWNHVSDLRGWDSSAAKLYSIKGIPHILVIDKNGTIVGKNLSDKELEEKIKEYLK